MGDNINMTADEFFDHWSEWIAMPLSASEAKLLTQVMVNILSTFEERGSPVHSRVVIDSGFDVYVSPDSREEFN